MRKDKVSNTGDIFEEYVIDEIFIEKNFSIIKKSPDFSNKYFKGNFDPDILIKCKKTKIEFWIECKYRTNEKKTIWIKFKQLFRYIHLEKNIKIYYLFGLGNTPKKPNTLCLVPISKFNILLKNKNVKHFKIPIQPIKDFNELLKLIPNN